MPAALKGSSSQRALTVREVAEYLSVDEKTIYRLVQRRELPGFKVAGAWRFRRAEIDAWIEASRETSVPRTKGAPRLRALLVEDDEVDRMAIRRAMRDTDPLGAMEVVEVTSLAAARAALAQAAWDCVVVDRQLPDGDGLSLLEDDQGSLGGAAVVVLTGLEDEELARTALRQGAQDYLIKGRVEGAALLRSVRYAVERKRFEDERLRSEANFRSLIEQSPDLVCALRLGHVAYANPAFAALLGKRREHLEGVEFQALVHPEDRGPLQAAIEAPAGDAVRPLFQVRLRADSGQWMQVEAWARPLLFDDAEAVLFTGRDVTRRKQLEEQVLFSSRMAATGTLAAGVAHEINNPLGFIVGNVDFALKELREVNTDLGGRPPDDGALRDLQRRTASVVESLADAMEGARRVKYIVRDLKTLARPSDSDDSATPLQRAVEWSISVVWNEIHHRARLVRQFRASPLVPGGETKLGQIVMNLLLNAAQAIPAGHADEHEIRVVIDQLDAERALLEVHDTGCGITPQDLPRIFDPFFTTKPVGIGTGLGLAVCHGIVTSLGGEISVESTVGQGTTFRVTVPLVTETPMVAPPVEAPPVARRRGRVLIIEDERLVASSLERGLGRQHDITVALTGKEGLALLETDSFDVILCDVMMPVMTGMDVYRQLAPAPRERLIFMTGGVFTPQVRQFLDSVPNTRLEKPMDLDTLAALLDARVAALDARGG
jgi:PAS domain S-box-containing protein/excisionase family DNA binding protein